MDSSRNIRDNPPRSFWQIVRDYLWVILPIALVFVAAAIYLYRFVDPAPPRQLTIATGSQDQTYYAVGRRLAAALEPRGITLKVLPTQGSVENLELLRSAESGVDLAFVQGGVESLAPGSEDAQQLTSLGSCFYEPFWLFHADSLELEHLTDLADARVAVGERGSGALAVAMSLLVRNGVAPADWSARALPDSAHPLYFIGGDRAADALLAGEVDAAFFVTSPRSQLVRRLLAAPRVGVFESQRTGAYLKRFSYLSAHTLHEGVIDLAANLPGRDRELMATTAMLVARQELHPAIIPLILKELRGVLDQPALIGERGDFPSAKYSSLPVNQDAVRFYENGPPFLQRFMPFWAAALIDRYIFMALPLVTILIPLLKVAGPAYRWRIRSRIYKWYRDLREVDARHSENSSSRGDRERDIRQLDELSEELSKINVPLSYADSLYDLQMHVDLLRRRLAGAPLEPTPEPPGGAPEEAGGDNAGERQPGQPG